jgi:hypothetical protein
MPGDRRKCGEIRFARPGEALAPAVPAQIRERISIPKNMGFCDVAPVEHVLLRSRSGTQRRAASPSLVARKFAQLDARRGDSIAAMTALYSVCRVADRLR